MGVTIAVDGSEELVVVFFVFLAGKVLAVADFGFCLGAEAVDVVVEFMVAFVAFAELAAVAVGC